MKPRVLACRAGRPKPSTAAFAAAVRLLRLPMTWREEAAWFGPYTSSPSSGCPMCLACTLCVHAQGEVIYRHTRTCHEKKQQHSRGVSTKSTGTYAVFANQREKASSIAHSKDSSHVQTTRHTNLIWCVRPVSSFHCTTAAPPAATTSSVW